MTLTSDFGLADHYVASMKAALVVGCPAVRLIDVTHQISRHDILCGSITLERAVDAFPDGTIHLAVVDPGVGTKRRILLTQINGQIVVCPDNGLITWAWRRMGPGRAFELLWRPKKSSHVFHGRDIMAPVAAKLAAGEPVESLARPIDDPVLLPVAPATAIMKGPAGGRVTGGRIIHIDHFGNATTNVGHELLKGKSRQIRVGNFNLGRIRQTYGDVPPGRPLALIGSSALLEIAVRDGSAADVLGLKVGETFRIQ